MHTDAEAVTHKTETQCAVKLLSKDVSNKSQGGERREDEHTERTSGREEDVSLSLCFSATFFHENLSWWCITLKMPHFLQCPIIIRRRPF